MPISGGYTGQILVVNLADSLGDSAIYDEPMPDEQVLRKFIGGAGLGLYYLRRELTALASRELMEGAVTSLPEPTDEDAPLIFMTGPLTGTAAPCSSSYAVVCLSLEVPLAAGVSHSHGRWGVYLKAAGYDGIVIRGKSDTPVYLVVDDGQVELRDASHLWGRDTRETERRIKEEVGGDPETISVASIGPGGEQMLHGGMIRNDDNHGAGRGSPGTVMGAKRLKAIAVRGSKPVPVARPDAFQEALARWEADLEGRRGQPSAAAAGQGDGAAGLGRFYSLLGERYLVPFKNLTDPGGGKAFAARVAEAAGRWRVTPKPCPNCKLGCAFDAEVVEGPFAGLIANLSGGAGSLEGAAAMIGLEDPDAALALAEFYNAKGLDASTMGAIIAMAFEAYAKGLFTRDDTGGLELTWGNHEVAMDLLGRMIAREGAFVGSADRTILFGMKLTPGLLKAIVLFRKERGEEFARELERMAVHIKGGGVLHDFRSTWGTLLGQIVSPAGPGWHAPGADFLAPEPDAGYATVQEGLADTPEGAREKVNEVLASQRSKLWLDCTGVCWFAKAPASVVAQAVGAAVGWDDFGGEEALVVGERVANTMRLIEVQRGDFLKEDEFIISPRLLEAPAVGPAAGKSIEPYLRAMVDEYYRQMGWDQRTGHPRPETRDRLGL